MAKVIFHSVHRGGVCLSACWDTTPLWEQTPLEQIHTPWSRHPPEQTPPWSRHPPGADTPPEQTPLGADTPRSRHPSEQTPPRSRLPWEQTPPQEQTPPLGADTPRSRHPPGKQTPAYGQWAAGTHPTGMHSCLECNASRWYQGDGPLLYESSRSWTIMSIMLKNSLSMYSSCQSHWGFDLWFKMLIKVSENIG